MPILQTIVFMQD